MAPTTDTPSTDFYRFVNGAWLDDPNVVIPDEYPRWGSFTKLADEGLINQIALSQELAFLPNPSDDQKKIAIIWQKSMQRFADWEAGKGSMDIIEKELINLKEKLDIPSDNTDVGKTQYVKNLAQYFGRCERIGITTPFSFGKEANLDSSNDIILDFSPSGLSLPSRDYYFEDNFEEQRKLFIIHLENIAKLVAESASNEELALEDNFSQRVMRFETKLATIRMKKDQSRQYDKYYTVTTLAGMYNDINSLKYLVDKEQNYLTANSNDDIDKEALTSTTYTVDDSTKALAKVFLSEIYDSLGLMEAMEKNYKKDYCEGDQTAEVKPEILYKMMAFDGDYFRRIFSILFRSENAADLRAYLQYQIVINYSNLCTKELDAEVFDFYSRKLRGQQQQKPADKRSVLLINSWVGELMGRVFVEKYFSPKDKETVLDMVHVVLDIMKSSITTNDWLTPPTKELALKKLDKFVVKIGYPDKWKDYSALTMSESDSLATISDNVHKFNFETEFLGKLNTVKDKTKWEMTPQTVNAYFHPLNNEIVFPAAILQPPFYTKSVDLLDFKLDEMVQPVPAHLDTEEKRNEAALNAANFGAIGAVIAHEITHGYDDQGRKFDADGNINDWWQPEDAQLFESKTKVMAEQAKTYVLEHVNEEDGSAKVHKMNAELTMGENLADLGGLSLASKALLRHLPSSVAQDPTQRNWYLECFFRAWACAWKSKEKIQFKIQALATDPHAPPSFRCNLVKNINGYYEVFGIKPEDPMYIAPEKRVVMW